MEYTTESNLANSSLFTRVAYNQKPDYTKPLLTILPEAREQLQVRLSNIYGEAVAKTWMPEMERILKVHYAHKPQELIDEDREFDPANRFTERDLILITYGDLLSSEDRSPLATLAHLLEAKPRLKGIVNTLHILPFFPYSSDKGFAVIDFRTVDQKLGSWRDIEEMGKRYKLMFDGVLNHSSSMSPEFQELLNGNPVYKDIVITFKSPDELTPEERSMIVRPRTSDILTKFDSIDGPIHVWTTFSPDQVDLNYKNPFVLMFMIETLLLYVRRGADNIRLDAVTYIWSEPGTRCVHMEEAHEIIKLFRDILNLVAPKVALTTATNVPHEENISYFGNGSDEAQMVYNFALPPLVLHTFYREDATALTGWARDLKYFSDTSTYFNMLDTHDGVGLMGVKDILQKDDIDFIIEKAREHGAFISYKTGADSSKEPYEINTTWFSALNHDNSSEDIAFQVKRFVASRSIALVLRGVPGIYFHGLIGTCNDTETVLETKSKRDINRRVIDLKTLNEAQKDPHSKLSHIIIQLVRILEIRIRQSAFHPNGDQHVLSVSPDVFSVFRVSPDARQHILTLTNITNRVCHIEVPLALLNTQEIHWYDLVSTKQRRVENQKLNITLQPYDVSWLTPFAEIEESIE